MPTLSILQASLGGLSGVLVGFSLGFVLKILITLLAGGAIFIALPRIVGALLEDALRLMGSVS